MKIRIPGYSSLTGSPAAIVDSMKTARFFGVAEDEDYIKTVVADIKRLYDVELHVEGSTLPEQAESLLRELAKNEFIVIEEE